MKSPWTSRTWKIRVSGCLVSGGRRMVFGVSTLLTHAWGELCVSVGKSTDSETKIGSHVILLFELNEMAISESVMNQG